MDPICISLPQVIKGAEILEVLHSLPNIRQYLFSLYECRYSVFFQSLGESAALITNTITTSTSSGPANGPSDRTLLVLLSSLVHTLTYLY